MLDIASKRPPKKVRGFRLDDKTWNTINEMSKAFSTTNARILEALVDQYGNKALENKLRMNKEEK
jgi:hypothetical protein